MNEAVDQPAAKKGAAKKAENPKDVDGEWNILKLARESEVTDPLLAALVFLTDYYGRPYSRNALSAGLPLEDGRVTPDVFVRALRASDSRAFRGCEPHPPRTCARIADSRTRSCPGIACDGQHNPGSFQDFLLSTTS